MIEFPSFDTVKTTPFAYRLLRNFLPNLSSSQWFYCLFAERKYFASKENQPLSRIEDVYEGIGPFWRPFRPSGGVYTHGRTDEETGGPGSAPPTRPRACEVRKMYTRSGGGFPSPPHSNIGTGPGRGPLRGHLLPSTLI